MRGEFVVSTEKLRDAVAEHGLHGSLLNAVDSKGLRHSQSLCRAPIRLDSGRHRLKKSLILQLREV
jgi:hypothetical protein